MKKSLLKSSFNILLAVCILSIVGCTRTLYDPETPPKLIQDGSVFDFSTEKMYTLNIKYNVPSGYKVTFEVYTENPVEVSEFGQISKKDVRPIDVGTTDEQGNYSYKINRVPASVDQLYIYSSNIGVPCLLTAKINGNQLEDAKVVNPATSKAMTSRSTDDYKNALYNQFDGFTVDPHRLGYWMNEANQHYGRPDYLYKDELVIDHSILTWLNRIVPNGKNNQSAHHLDNYLVSGDIKVTEKSNIWLYFVDEGTGAYNSLGYYSYETNNPPKQKSDIENRTTIAFPHTKKIGNSYGYGALKTGEGVQLHYIDENGVNQGTEFPEGTSIGWVIYNNAYQNAAKKGEKLTAKGNGSTNSVIYSTPGLRPNKDIPQVALFRKDQFIALTMEDWHSGDWDYNDIMFSVKADPIEAILPEIPEPTDPEDPETPVAAEYEGLLTFEDLWPYQGDFDMNDVVVHYKTKIFYNDKNEIEKTEDTFTLLWSGATHRNGFGYLLKTTPDNIKIESTQEVTTERDINTGNTIVRLFSDAIEETERNTKTSEITVTTTFIKPISKSNIDLAPYNPFITTGNKKNEVHLTNNVPTSFADENTFGTADDLSIYGQGIYYVTLQRDQLGEFTTQQMPFAIHILSLKKNQFVIPQERKRIDTYYPKFLNWVNSKGQDDTDWFKHPITEMQ